MTSLDISNGVRNAITRLREAVGMVRRHSAGAKNS